MHNSVFIVYMNLDCFFVKDDENKYGFHKPRFHKPGRHKPVFDKPGRHKPGFEIVWFCRIARCVHSFILGKNYIKASGISV